MIRFSSKNYNTVTFDRIIIYYNINRPETNRLSNRKHIKWSRAATPTPKLTFYIDLCLWPYRSLIFVFHISGFAALFDLAIFLLALRFLFSEIRSQWSLFITITEGEEVYSFCENVCNVQKKTSQIPQSIYFLDQH